MRIVDYSPPAYKARNLLAAIDHEEHLNLEYAKDEAGEIR